MARLHERDCPLRIPPSSPRGSMTTKELQNACFKAYYTIQNLSSTQPEYRDHRILTIQNDTSRVNAIVVVPGGRHVIIAQDNGVIGLWDLEVVLAATPLLASAHMQNPAPQRVGKCLASYESTPSIHLMKSTVSGNSDEMTISIVALGGQRWVGHA